jgi:hypothetical protein
VTCHERSSFIPVVGTYSWCIRFVILAAPTRFTPLRAPIIYPA